MATWHRAAFRCGPPIPRRPRGAWGMSCTHLPKNLQTHYLYRQMGESVFRRFTEYRGFTLEEGVFSGNPRQNWLRLAISGGSRPILNISHRYGNYIYIYITITIYCQLHHFAILPLSINADN